jgi:iron-sulfur cluster assembly accessory protein
LLDKPSGSAKFQVTDRAASRIATILAAEPAGSVLRIGVSGGGCSGFSYEFSCTSAPEPDDLLIPAGSSTVVIDTVSLTLLEGTVLDFVDDLMGQSFRFDNPNATASCGCGTSFSIA